MNHGGFDTEKQECVEDCGIFCEMRMGEYVCELGHPLGGCKRVLKDGTKICEQPDFKCNKYVEDGMYSVINDIEQGIWMAHCEAAECCEHQSMLESGLGFRFAHEKWDEKLNDPSASELVKAQIWQDIKEYTEEIRDLCARKQWWRAQETRLIEGDVLFEQSLGMDTKDRELGLHMKKEEVNDVRG